MERFPEFATEFQFVERLVSEQSVFCLPGKVINRPSTKLTSAVSKMLNGASCMQCFEYADYFRIVLTVPKEQLLIALDRIMDYCNDHYVEKNKPASRSIVQVGEDQVEINHNNNHVVSAFHKAVAANNARMARIWFLKLEYCIAPLIIVAIFTNFRSILHLFHSTSRLALASEEF